MLITWTDNKTHGPITIYMYSNLSRKLHHFQNRKSLVQRVRESSFIYNLNTNTRQSNNWKINFKCSVLIKSLKGFPFYPIAVGKSILANLACFAHGLAPGNLFFYYRVCCPLKNHMWFFSGWHIDSDFSVASALIKKINGANLTGARPCGWNWQRCRHFGFIWTRDLPTLTSL